MDAQLAEVGRRGGLAILNHPYSDNESLEWHTKLFRGHSAESLVGLELAGDEASEIDFSIALWDQLLGALMPRRPIWDFGAYDGTYPKLVSIAVDRDAGEVSIDASGYDEILWISQPSSSGPKPDAAAPWPAGTVVQRGPLLDYSKADATLRYVRAEIVRRSGDGAIRLFLNPFALMRPR